MSKKYPAHLSHESIRTPGIADFYVDSTGVATEEILPKSHDPLYFDRKTTFLVDRRGHTIPSPGNHAVADAVRDNEANLTNIPVTSTKDQ
jgi:hypothetical protein